MTYNDKMDEIEEEMLHCEPVQCRVTHEFFGGHYIRTIFMPKGTAVTSMTHNTEHNFFMLTGKVRVIDQFNGVQTLQAPHIGTTTPGTRRLLEIVEDSVWTAAYKTDIIPASDSDTDINEAVDKICDQIIQKRENPLIGGMARNNVILKVIENEN